MKEDMNKSNAKQSDKLSPLSYILSIFLIGVVAVAIASIMGCSLPYS